MRRPLKRLVLLMGAGLCMAEVNTRVPDLAELKRMAARFAPVELRVDISKLSAGDRKALAKLVEAAQVIDNLILRQIWSGNTALYEKLKEDKSPLGEARLHYFWLNKGPWSALDEHQAFLPGVPSHKPAGANFYPEDMTKEEFEKFAASLPEDQKKDAIGFFSVVRRSQGKLNLVPYSREYADEMKKLSSLLKEAAAATDNATLKKFLNLRADAFLSNDYYESDVAWMDLDAPLDITIGPYETYNDELFGYKAAYEAYITLRDEAESKKLAMFADHLQEIENNLPIDPKYRNPKIGALAPIRVVNEIIATGDAAKGVRTAAYNLPNDERVISQKGSKRVMLKNVQEAKFAKTLVPISKHVLDAAAQKDLSFDSFFTHILAHEMTHGIGPHQIKVDGRETTPRKELKDLYSAIEEAKADICGLFMIQYMFDKKLLPGGPEQERKLYTTFLASSFRTLRFGLTEAHAKGMAIQMHFLLDKGAFIARPNGTFAVDFAKVKDGVRSLAHDLLTIEATGNHAEASRLLTASAKLRPELARAIETLKSIPTDIDPNHVTARALLNQK